MYNSYLWTVRLNVVNGDSLQTDPKKSSLVISGTD